MARGSFWTRPAFTVLRFATTTVLIVLIVCRAAFPNVPEAVFEIPLAVTVVGWLVPTFGHIRFLRARIRAQRVERNEQ